MAGARGMACKTVSEHSRASCECDSNGVPDRVSANTVIRRGPLRVNASERLDLALGFARDRINSDIRYV
jgi:hypothetical protein